MEYCINEERALKSNFHSAYAVKTAQPTAFLDELLGVNGINGVSCDDFSVDVFLDLSNEEEFVEEESEEEEKDSFSVSSQEFVESQDGLNCSTFSGNIDHCGSISAGDISVPADEIENLEWLSQIVDDSASELSLLCPTATFKDNTKNRFEPVSRPPIQRTPTVICFPSPVPAKARSKRPRSTSRSWSRASSSLSESSSTPSSSCGSSPTSVPVSWNPAQYANLVMEPVLKKQRKRPVAEETGGGSQTQRRCSHCGVQKTPQWRTGPLGAKTLCNACGVRYKSGRLFPEYRPACSPTFSGDVHSNSHRKVLEMRRQKEVPGVESG